MGWRCGEGSVFNKLGFLVYQGEWYFDNFHGKGVLYKNKSDAIIYQGHFAMGRPHGHGILYREDGSKRVEGKWWKGKIRGRYLKFAEEGAHTDRNRDDLLDFSFSKWNPAKNNSPYFGIGE